MLLQQNPAPAEEQEKGTGQRGCGQGDAGRLTGTAATPHPPLPQDAGAAPSSAAGRGGLCWDSQAEPCACGGG